MAISRSTIKADNNQDKTTVPFPLFDLPSDPINKEICPNFSLNECGLFAQTSQASEKAVAFLRLLPSAVDAEPESYKPESYLKDKKRLAATPKSYQIPDGTKLAAITILQGHLQKDPELLFRPGLVTDHYGRKIWASAIRLFFGTGDIWALKQIYESIIPHIAEGEAKAQAQFKLQFPDCPWPFDPSLGEEQLYDKRNKAQIAQVTTQLQIIDQKISADLCTNGLATLDETKKAVADLDPIFKPKEEEVIRTGLHFPLGIMKEIYKVYDARRLARLNNQPNAWSWAQLAFFSRAVLGKALAALTSVDGQCVKYGLENLNMEKGPDRRDGLFCLRPKGIPQNLAPIDDELGRTMFVDPVDGYSCFMSAAPGYFDWYNKNGCGGMARYVRAVGGIRARVLDNLWRTKAETYGSYYAAARREVSTPS